MLQDKYMKLRRTIIISGSIGIGAIAGYMIEPALRPSLAAMLGIEADEPAIAQTTDPEQKEEVIKQPGKEKTNVDVDDLLGGIGGEIPEEIETVDDTIAVNEADDIDAGSFKDITLDESDDGPVDLKRFRRKGGMKAQDALEEAYVAKSQESLWRNPKRFKSLLAGRIRARLKSNKPEDIATFLEDPKNRLALAQWELLNSGDLNALNKVMSSGNGYKTLEPLLNDLRWVSGFVYDGEIERTDVALAILLHLRQIDPNMDMIEMSEQDTSAHPAPTIKRRIAAAIAAEYARQGWYGNTTELSAREIREMERDGIPMPRTAAGRKGKADTYKLARERYQFFAESVEQRLLNSYFYVMPNWLMRFTCGWKGNSEYGSPTTMRWLRDNVAAPARAYIGMGGQVPYLPTNIFGDSIHGPFYYAPFRPLYPENMSKMVRDIGAVCGGVSHFAISSANANGVPGMTMGEPGHCAYAVFVDGRWHAGNSISKERSMHWSFWGSSSWSTLTAYTDMYNAGAVTRDAQMIKTLADLLAQNRNPNFALDIYQMAITSQPLLQSAWQQYVATASEHLARSPKKWLAVNKFLCEALAPDSPESCANYLTETIYPAMLKRVPNNNEKVEAIKVFFANLDKQEESVWDIEPLLQMQFDPLPKSMTIRMNYFEALVDTAMKKPEFSSMVTWAVRTAHNESKPLAKALMTYIDSKREECKSIALIDAAVIRAAEELQDEELFHKYSAPYLAGKNNLPNIEPLPGKLISENAMVLLSDYHPDRPESVAYHASALSKKGGSIYSLPGKHQTVTVVLERAKRIGGIVIVPEGSLTPYIQWKIDVSRDGKTWETFIELPDAYNKPYIRLNILRDAPNAKYIRIDSGKNQTHGIQFKSIQIYDNSKSSIAKN